MRIGILSYPMLLQRDPGLQARLRMTIQALRAVPSPAGQPLQVDLVDADPTHLDSYDVLHVFSAGGGNHRLVEAAAELGMPIIVSPLVAPGWDRRCGVLARQSDHRLGQQTGFALQSSYAQTRRALQLASLVVALGAGEKKAIEEGFLIDPSRVRLLSNGVSAHLFDVDGQLFRQRTGIVGPFVLMAGPISPYHNQLGPARQLVTSGVKVVVLGEVRERDHEYLAQLRALPGLTCLGGLPGDGRMLASAQAAASVLLLPGHGDSGVRGVFDALATGTPVVCGGTLALPDSRFALHQVAWDDGAAVSGAVLQLLAAAPPRDAVRALVRPYTWQRAAAELLACYQALVSEARVPHG